MAVTTFCHSRGTVLKRGIVEPGLCGVGLGVHYQCCETYMTGIYCVTSPTIAVFEQDGQFVSATVPVGALITIEGLPLDGETLVKVIWNGCSVMMFTQDLKTRAQPAD